MSKHWLQIKNQADTGPVEIQIYDQIGKDWWTGDGVVAKEFADELKKIPQDKEIVVAINSPGGNVWDGLAIANMLITRNVTTRNDGIAASIASIIFLAGKKRIANEASLTMIHRAWGGAVGNAADMEKMAADLKKHDQVLAEFIANRTGKPLDEVVAKMEAETWFTGNEAKDFGMADEILATPNIQNSVSPEALARYKNAPESIKNLSTSAVEPKAATVDPVKPVEPPKEPEAPKAVEPVAPQNQTAVKPQPNNTKKTMESADQKEMFAIAKRLNKMDEYEKAIENGVSLNDFRASIVDSFKAPTKVEIVEPKYNSVGEAFVGSDAYKNALKNKAHRSISFDVPIGFQNATGTTSGLTSIEKLPGLVTLNQQPLTIASLIPSTATDAVTIRYIQENSFTNAATAVAEEGQKPEASWDLTEVDATVRKIAVVGRVTDEMFADFAQTRDYVNNRLRYMVQAKEDNHLLNGTGSNNQIKGLLNFSGVQSQAVGGNTVLDAIHKAITKVRSTGFSEPNAIVIHPSDYEGIKLMKDSDGQYLNMGPYAANVATIWGLPVVQTTAISSGTALLGNFNDAQIYRKMGLTVDTTNSDASDFVYNRIAIRAETRLALACYRPLSFCTVTGIA